jgi:hypothetical protein
VWTGRLTAEIRSYCCKRKCYITPQLILFTMGFYGEQLFGNVSEIFYFVDLVLDFGDFFDSGYIVD